MRIVFEQSGGFMGRTVSMTVNLEDLPPEQAGALRSMLEQARFFQMGSDLAPRPARDEFHYRITVETEKTEHTVRATDSSAPPELRPLLQELSRMARARQRK